MSAISGIITNVKLTGFRPPEDRAASALGDGFILSAKNTSSLPAIKIGNTVLSHENALTALEIASQFGPINNPTHNVSTPLNGFAAKYTALQQKTSLDRGGLV